MTTTMKKIIAIFALATIALAVFVFWRRSADSSRNNGLFGNDSVQTSEDGIRVQGDGAAGGHDGALERKMQKLEAKVAMMGAVNKNAASSSGELSDEEIQRREEYERIEDEKARLAADPVARKAKVMEIYSETMQQFEAQEFDAGWAEPVESNLRQDFSAITTEAGARLQAVECRTNACIAKIEFNDYEHAKNNVDDWVARPYGVRCKTRVVTPEPDDPASPYEVTLFFRECDRGEAAM